MAVLQEIWAGKIPDFLRRKFLMRGGLRMQMPGDIQPIVDIDNVEIADRFSLGENLYCVGILQGAVAAAFSRVALLNSLGSGIIVENEQVLLAATTNQLKEFHDGAALAGFNPFLPEDSRSDRWTVVTSHPVLITSDTNVAQFPAGAAVQPGTLVAPALNVAPAIYPIKFVLTPGHQWGIADTIVNNGVFAYFIGRYRLLLPGES